MTKKKAVKVEPIGIIIIDPMAVLIGLGLIFLGSSIKPGVKVVGKAPTLKTGGEGKKQQHGNET
jgi:hypothetical protein